jgi:hypothetical protein
VLGAADTVSLHANRRRTETEKEDRILNTDAISTSKRMDLMFSMETTTTGADPTSGLLIIYTVDGLRVPQGYATRPLRHSLPGWRSKPLRPCSS